VPKNVNENIALCGTPTSKHAADFFVL